MDPRMLLPAWVSIATVRPYLEAAGCAWVRFAEMRLHIIDHDCTLPSHQSKNQHQKRNIGFSECLLGREFYQHVLVTTAASFDTGE
jgi:hypothetical protein